MVRRNLFYKASNLRCENRLRVMVGGAGGKLGVEIDRHIYCIKWTRQDRAYCSAQERYAISCDLHGKESENEWVCMYVYM